jgi:hypothetical protein
MPVEMWERTTVELRPSNDPEGYIVAHVMVDGQEVVSIWCNKIGVFPMNPPMYSLEYDCKSGCHLNICGISTPKIKIDSRIKGIPEATIKALGKYAEVTG